MTSDDLTAIEPAAEGTDFEVTSSRDTYEITVPSAAGTGFSIERDAAGVVKMTCDQPGEGYCKPDGTW